MGPYWTTSDTFKQQQRQQQQQQQHQQQQQQLEVQCNMFPKSGNVDSNDGSEGLS